MSDKPDCAKCGCPYEKHAWGPFAAGGMGYKDYGMCYALGPWSMYTPVQPKRPTVSYRSRVWASGEPEPLIGAWHSKMRTVLVKGLELAADLSRNVLVDRVSVAVERSDGTVLWEQCVTLPAEPSLMPTGFPDG